MLKAIGSSLNDKPLASAFHGEVVEPVCPKTTSSRIGLCAAILIGSNQPHSLADDEVENFVAEAAEHFPLVLDFVLGRFDQVADGELLGVLAVTASSAGAVSWIITLPRRQQAPSAHTLPVNTTFNKTAYSAVVVSGIRVAYTTSSSVSILRTLKSPMSAIPAGVKRVSTMPWCTLETWYSSVSERLGDDPGL